jgi:hypothetical protein
MKMKLGFFYQIKTTILYMLSLSVLSTVFTVITCYINKYTILCGYECYDKFGLFSDPFSFIDLFVILIILALPISIVSLYLFNFFHKKNYAFVFLLSLFSLLFVYSLNSTLEHSHIVYPIYNQSYWAVCIAQLITLLIFIHGFHYPKK